MSQKIILFDFDGTLADTFLLGSRLINEYADKFGYARIDFAKNKNKSAKELIKMAKVKFWEIPRLLRFFRSQTLKFANEISAFEGIENLIKDLFNCGYRMGIVSTNTKEIIDIFLKKYNLQSYFSYFRTEVSLFGKKRALKLSKRNLKSNNIIYVGDEVRDIEGANKAKIPIISCTWGFNNKEILFKHNDLVVSNCNELKEKIMEFNY